MRVGQPCAGRSTRRTFGIPCALALLVASLTFLSACGSGSSSGGTAATSGTPAAGVAPVELPASTKPVQTLNWALPRGEPASLDPSLVGELSSILVASNMCEGLQYMNPDSTVTDGLATASRPSATSYKFTLKPGVKFWDGKPLTPEDVVYSLSRIWKDPNAPLNFFFANVKSIEASGSDAVVVKLKQPDELLLKALASPAGAIVQKAFAEKAGKKFGTPSGGVMCTGPLKFNSWRPGESITLDKNTNYWNPKRASRANKVVLSFVPNAAALTQGLQSGQYDGAYELPASVVPALKSSSTGKLTLGQSSESLNLKVANPGGPLAKAQLRDAVFAALNREEIGSGAFNGAAQASYTYVPTNYWDPDPAAQKVWKAAYPQWVKANAYNLAKAKELAKSSGVANRPLTVGILAGDATVQAAAQILQQQLAAAGIKLNIRPLPANQYAPATYDASARKGLDFLMGTNFNITADPAELMGFEVQPGGAYNYTGFKNKQMYENVLRARASYDPALRAKLLTQTQTAYEKARLGTALVAMNEGRFLNNRLTGGTTSYPYVFEPSLALIGAK